MSIARLLALAFPERIGKARGAPGQFLLANGRGAALDATDPLARSPFLVAAELSGPAASTRILLAASANETDVLLAAGQRMREADEVDFDRQAAALRSRRVRRLDAIILASEPRAVAADDGTARLLAGHQHDSSGWIALQDAPQSHDDSVGLILTVGQHDKVRGGQKPQRAFQMPAVLLRYHRQDALAVSSSHGPIHDGIE